MIIDKGVIFLKYDYKGKQNYEKPAIVRCKSGNQELSFRGNILYLKVSQVISLIHQAAHGIPNNFISCSGRDIIISIG
jgi:hypothetical protein